MKCAAMYNFCECTVYSWVLSEPQIGTWWELRQWVPHTSGKHLIMQELLMLLNCGVGEDSWQSLGLQGDPTSQA